MVKDVRNTKLRKPAWFSYQEMFAWGYGDVEYVRIDPDEYATFGEYIEYVIDEDHRWSDKYRGVRNIKRLKKLPKQILDEEKEKQTNRISYAQEILKELEKMESQLK